MKLEEYSKLKIGDTVYLDTEFAEEAIECEVLDVNHKLKRTKLAWKKSTIGMRTVCYGLDLIHLIQK